MVNQGFFISYTVLDNDQKIYSFFVLIQWAQSQHKNKVINQVTLSPEGVLQDYVVYAGRLHPEVVPVIFQAGGK